MPESINTKENFPNETQITAQLEAVLEGKSYVELRQLVDEHGVYLIEWQTTDDVGDILLVSYRRAGNFVSGFSSTTCIEKVFYMGDIPRGGETVATYTNGRWNHEV